MSTERSNLKKLQVSISKWYNLECSLGEKIQGLANARNETTYYDHPQSGSSFQGAFSTSKLIIEARSKIITLVDESKDILNKLMTIYESIITLSKTFVEETQIIEYSYLQSIVSQIKDQTILDQCTAEYIINSIESWIQIDQNEMMTMLACFKYKPYLTTSVVESFLKLEI